MASIVSQDPFILDGIFTIRENLLLGVARATSDEVLWKLLEDFGLAKKIRSFRLGLDTPLGWDIDLSGGQRQLIVIIRVILQDRQILIFDEGTSQLDAENEMLVMKRLLERKSNKIIIFITHRLSTVRKADTILCLEKGKISDMGNHGELLARDSLYKKFYEMQMSEKFEGGGDSLG
jgi:ABC-type multidrug transport system fused ATPase/permease subunit